MLQIVGSGMKGKNLAPSTNALILTIRQKKGRKGRLVLNLTTRARPMSAHLEMAQKPSLVQTSELLSIPKRPLATIAIKRAIGSRVAPNTCKTSKMAR